MNKTLVLSLTADDKPGIVETIANTVNRHHGNWLESQLAQLAGKFAGVISVSIANENIEDLRKTLNTLEKQGIYIQVDQIDQSQDTQAEGALGQLLITGPDRVGIVKEVSKALADQSINVYSLNTWLSSMPYSGDPLFEAEASILIPEHVDTHAIQDKLDAIADNLGIDVSLNLDFS